VELQTWLDAAGEREVEVPFASALADLIPPIDVRLRRDFPLVMSLIRAHALLHQITRERDSDGRIVATLRDYAAVHGLVSDLIALGIRVAIPKGIREVVEAIRQLRDDGAVRVTLSMLGEKLGVHKSNASRRATQAIRRGFLENRQPGPGRAGDLYLNDPLPEDQEVLPSPELVANRCGVALESGGYEQVEKEAPDSPDVENEPGNPWTEDEDLGA
jgi:hypothetical protein